jgi:preprotein translocase subunit SecD
MVRSCCIVCLLVVLTGCASSTVPGRQSGFRSFPFAANRVELYRAWSEPKEGARELRLSRTGTKVFVDSVPEITASDIANAQAEIDAREEPTLVVLKLTFNESGQKKMERLSRDHKGQRLAIFVDKQLRVAPELQYAISDSIQVLGAITQQEAEPTAKASDAGK